MRKSSGRNILNNTRCRVSVNNASTSDYSSFHSLIYNLRDTDAESSYAHNLSIRSRTVIQIKTTVPEQNATNNGSSRTLDMSSLEVVWVLIRTYAITSREPASAFT